METGQGLQTDRYYLFPEAIMGDAGKVPNDWQTQLLREQRIQTLRLCAGQSRPSFLCAGRSSPSWRGRRVQAKNGASVWNAGGGI
jgi:hypothetical protein